MNKYIEIRLAGTWTVGHKKMSIHDDSLERLVRSLFTTEVRIDSLRYCNGYPSTWEAHVTMFDYTIPCFPPELLEGG